MNTDAINHVFNKIASSINNNKKAVKNLALKMFKIFLKTTNYQVQELMIKATLIKAVSNWINLKMNLELTV